VEKPTTRKADEKPNRKAEHAKSRTMLRSMSAKGNCYDTQWLKLLQLSRPLLAHFIKT